MTAALIGLGSNLGDRSATLRTAIDELARLSRSTLLAASPFRETSPVGGPAGQPPYLNAAALLETRLEPLELLDALQHIETSLGRTRTGRWTARTIDLDLLLHGESVLQTPRLTLPHPRMAWRRFVLEGAADVAPRLVHPVIGWSIADLLQHLTASPPYLAITGRPAGARTELAHSVAASLGGEMLFDPEPPPPAEPVPQPAADRWMLAAARLDWRASLLAVVTPQLGGLGRWFASDFWLDAAWFDVAHQPGEAEREAFRRHWQRCRRRAPRPRLLVALDASGGEDRESQALRERERAFFRELDIGPFLEWNSPDLAAAAEEISAAWLAMTARSPTGGNG